MKNEHDGQGGSYVIGDDGDRKLVERTKEPGEEAPPDDPAPALPAKTPKPAKAGFSLPVAPADQPTNAE